MSYLCVNEQCLQKIEKYVTKIKEAYEQVKELDDAQIDDSLIGYALTQCMTNLYEAISRVDSDKLSQKLWPISRLTRTTRNIASHDYDSINWDIVKENCKAIIKKVTPKFLAACREICEVEKAEVTDYTD